MQNFGGSYKYWGGVAPSNVAGRRSPRDCREYRPAIAQRSSQSLVSVCLFDESSLDGFLFNKGVTFKKERDFDQGQSMIEMAPSRLLTRSGASRQYHLPWEGGCIQQHFPEAWPQC